MHDPVTMAPETESEPVAHVIRAPPRWATGLPAIAVTIRRSIQHMGASRAVKALAVINQPDGYDCPGCAWPEAPPSQRHRVEFCESGAKAVAEARLEHHPPTRRTALPDAALDTVSKEP